MANISLTSQCNRACSYCFAPESASRSDAIFMSEAAFDRALDFLERSEISEVRMLGGEPTVHPRFTKLLDRALERSFRILLFSGGMIPGPVLARLSEIPEDRLLLLLNVVSPDGDQRELKRQHEVMEVLGPRLAPGFNIDRPGVRLEFLINLIGQHELARFVRLGLAHPILDGDNRYLKSSFYPEVGGRVANFAWLAREQGIEIEFDCG